MLSKIKEPLHRSGSFCMGYSPLSKSDYHLYLQRAIPVPQMNKAPCRNWMLKSFGIAEYKPVTTGYIITKCFFFQGEAGYLFIVRVVSIKMNYICQYRTTNNGSKRQGVEVRNVFTKRHFSSNQCSSFAFASMNQQLSPIRRIP